MSDQGTARSRAADHNAQSRLLKLPPEVRNKIYEHVLSRGRKALRGTNLHKPGLLQVCGQIREEANLMFYDLRNFHMFATVSNLDVMDSWTTLVSTAELNCIHRLSFQLEFIISEGGVDRYVVSSCQFANLILHLALTSSSHRVFNAIRHFSSLLWLLF